MYQRHSFPLTCLSSSIYSVSEKLMLKFFHIFSGHLISPISNHVRCYTHLQLKHSEGTATTTIFLQSVTYFFCFLYISLSYISLSFSALFSFGKRNKLDDSSFKVYAIIFLHNKKNLVAEHFFSYFRGWFLPVPTSKGLLAQLLFKIKTC